MIGKYLKVQSFYKYRSAIRSQKGFSLLELLIAMFILIILLSIALPAYQSTVQHAREIVLEENLWQMRRAVDQYAADKGKLPQSLDDLKDNGYLREVPIDPITEESNWKIETGEDIYSSEGGQGIKDVRSVAPGTDSNGKRYSEY